MTLSVETSTGAAPEAGRTSALDEARLAQNLHKIPVQGPAHLELPPAQHVGGTSGGHAHQLAVGRRGAHAQELGRDP